jgi:hypothetical protein
LSFDVQGVAMSLAGLGENPDSLPLVAAAKAEWQRIGVEVQGTFWNVLLDRYIGDIGNPSLDDGDVSAAGAKGASMGLEEAVDTALRLSSAGTQSTA